MQLNPEMQLCLNVPACLAIQTPVQGPTAEERQHDNDNDNDEDKDYSENERRMRKRRKKAGNKGQTG